MNACIESPLTLEEVAERLGCDEVLNATQKGKDFHMDLTSLL